MKMKKKILLNGDANAENWRRRGCHFRSRRRGRQRLVDGVVRREEEKRNSNGPDAGDVTVQHVDDENRKAENEFHRPGRKVKDSMKKPMKIEMNSSIGGVAAAAAEAAARVSSSDEFAK